MLSVDAKAAVPRNFQLPDLEPEGLVLRWNAGNAKRHPAASCGTPARPKRQMPRLQDFTWQHPTTGRWRSASTRPRRSSGSRRSSARWAAAASDTGRVEVPFSCIVPEEKAWWTADSRAGIDVPLGRAGAMKLQHLDLGGGTSQHVLISGKTGSGKSTLLHVLITNLALRYSPDEVELYLVDFKKGVEFKAYARSALPHARVVAIESEREFGLSVLQRLDAELRTRGDLLPPPRAAGHQGFPQRREWQGAGRQPAAATLPAFSW